MIKYISGLDESKTGKLDTTISAETDTLADQYTWTLTTPDGSLLNVGSGQGKQVVFTLTNFLQPVASSNGAYTITVDPKVERKQGGEIDPTMESKGIETETFSISSPVDDRIAIYTPFVSSITDIKNDEISLGTSWNELKEKLTNQIKEDYYLPIDTFRNVNITYNINDKRDLNTFLHFGDDKMLLTTNVKTDKETFEELPYSAIFKLYEPLPDDIEEKDKVYIVREILPQITETVELKPYDQEEEDVLVLRVPDSAQVESPITKRSTEFKNYDDLVTSDVRLQKEIEDKYLTEKPTNLNIDYSNYDNFINFSSAEKRLKNFKYKVELLETYTAESASLVNISNSQRDLTDVDNKIRGVKKNFDGYETYLYSTKSSYVTSSIGEFPNASWPKAGSGSYEFPYAPITSSHTEFTDWYGSIASKTGQLYSASLYDIDNANRLVNLLPEHVKDDIQNNQFFDFLDMIGQQFDEIWSYTTAMAQVTDRQNDLSEGFSKDLVFNLAKSLGWTQRDGKDLLDLSRLGFGQKLSGTTYSLYTSGSLDSPPESDVSKEITKRLISSMPYLLKAKGTIGALKGVLNCYGIPSSILRVREYGGLQKSNHKAQFEIARKFTRALRFKTEQYVETSWDDDGDSNRKPETVEFRFRAVSGSDQILVQKDTDWAIKLKDNDSTDNYGTVAFMLTGSFGLQEISSSLLPVFDGDYHSVMLRKTKIEPELFLFPSFETASLFNPPFIKGISNAENGDMQIVSSSDVAKSGTKSLVHINTSFDGSSFSKFYKKPPNDITDNIAATSVTPGETFVFSAYAKVSSSIVDSVGRLSLFELDSNEEVVNWDQEFEYSLQDGGIKSSEQVGLNETEWKQIVVQKTVKFPNTANLGVRFENVKPQSTIFWDDISLRKVSANTDSINDNFNYDLYVKKYEAGLDRIIHSSKSTLHITGSASQSYNASWTGSGDLFIGGHNTGTASGVFDAGRFGGSLMEFRLWTEPLEEQSFNLHVENPKSYVGNSPSSSYYNLVRRFSFDDNITLSDGDSIRDTSANQTTTQTGSAQGFSGENTFETVVDKTKTIVPNSGPNRRMATKIRLENNVLSGSGASLSINERYDVSANDFSPLDSPKLGIYFSPVDVINEDIISSFANLDFNQYLGDPRDVFEENYSGLSNVSKQYFQKYTSGSATFWDYMHIIKYYDQSIFKQLKKLVPARAKTQMGTLIEGSIFERSKSPVQKNNPSVTQPFYQDTINVSRFVDTAAYGEQEQSGSTITIETEYPNYTGNIDSTATFRTPSLYTLNQSLHKYINDETLYISGSAKFGGPSKVFSEPTGSIVLDNRKSELNKQYKFYYTSSAHYAQSQLTSLDKYVNLYSSKSLVETDLDPGYQHITALNNSFYEGVKNTISTTTDGDYPVVIRVTSPTVAVPTDSTDTNLNIIDSE
tara:strand:- start:2934 stop:7196 length:4263 start_codon:yes stop_codon:yes gene_type:complete